MVRTGRPTMPCTGRFTSGASLAGFAPVNAVVRRTDPTARCAIDHTRLEQDLACTLPTPASWQVMD